MQIKTYLIMSIMISIDIVIGNLEHSFVQQRNNVIACDGSNTPINLGTADNVLACSRLCSSKRGCLGFYFNKTDCSCWVSNLTECQMAANAEFYRKDCGTPPAINNAVLSSGDTHVGETRSYTCSQGYVLHNVVIMDTTCQSDGTWSIPSFDCLWDCGTPPAINNAVLSSGDTHVGETRSYTCSQDYDLHNVVIVDTTCQSDGTWSIPSFDCLWGWCNTDDVGCPSGWCHVGFSCYMVYDTNITLGDSMTFCQNTNYSSHMVQLETAEEDAAVVANIMQNFRSAKFCFGLYVPLQNGVWKWMTTKARPTYSKWVWKKPDVGPYFVRVAASDNYQWRYLKASYRCQPLCEISLQ